MVRDPVCGTYVVRERALAASHGSHQVFFCSAGCRDRYSSLAGRTPAGGRTA
jgi:YHS domain-containing protein